MSEKVVTAAEIIRDVTPSAPPVAYLGMTVCGVSLPDIVSIATLGYLALQVAFIIYKWRKHK